MPVFAALLAALNSAARARCVERLLVGQLLASRELFACDFLRAKFLIRRLLHFLNLTGLRGEQGIGLPFTRSDRGQILQLGRDDLLGGRFLRLQSTRSLRRRVVHDGVPNLHSGGFQSVRRGGC